MGIKKMLPGKVPDNPFQTTGDFGGNWKIWVETIAIILAIGGILYIIAHLA